MIFAERPAAYQRAGLVGVKIHVSGAHVGQIERGEVRCREETAEALDSTLDSRGTIHSLWKQCVKSAVFPTWFDWYEIEAEARDLKSYQSMVVIGLLQTPDYASALLRHDKEAVAARIGRQEVLFREDPPPPRLSLLLYEGVLRNEIGGKGNARAARAPARDVRAAEHLHSGRPGAAAAGRVRRQLRLGYAA